LAASITERRPGWLSVWFSLHANEIVLAVQDAMSGGGTYRLTATLEPSESLPAADRGAVQRANRLPSLVRAVAGGEAAYAERALPTSLLRIASDFRARCSGSVRREG
jgi:hypothetical protein